MMSIASPLDTQTKPSTPAAKVNNNTDQMEVLDHHTRPRFRYTTELLHTKVRSPTRVGTFVAPPCLAASHCPARSHVAHLHVLLSRFLVQVPAGEMCRQLWVPHRRERPTGTAALGQPHLGSDAELAIDKPVGECLAWNERVESEDVLGE